ncbi:hypothetical protein B0H13DRAFT_2343427 [Mycena leptocephala]|nr:hypothetical protein B0H13DRAFT_2343427 [Mycena leptocephala]
MSGRGYGRGKARPTGELHTHRPHVATTVEVSADRQRAILTSTPVGTTTPGIATYYAEDVATARALEGPDFSYFLGDEGNWAAEGHGQDESERDGITLAGEETFGEQAGVTGTGKKNFERWDNTDFPMRVFVHEHREETLDEMLRAEGRGSSRFHEKCPAMYCEQCIADLHCQLPMHMLEIKEWTGTFFKPTTMDELGIDARLQLGHAPGTYCPKATKAHCWRRRVMGPALK